MYCLKSELIKMKIHFPVVLEDINMNQFLQGLQGFREIYHCVLKSGLVHDLIHPFLNCTKVLGLVP